LAAGTLWGAYALPQTTLAAMGCLLLRGPVVSKYVSLLNRLAAIQLDRSIKCHSKTQPHKQSLKHKKNMKNIKGEGSEGKRGGRESMGRKFPHESQGE